MKKILVLIIFLFQLGNCFCQNRVNELLSHYNKVSVDSLYEVTKIDYRHILDSIYLELSGFIDAQSSSNYFQFGQNKPVLIIQTYLSKRIETYKSAEDIANYFEISPNPYQLALLNENKKLIAIVKPEQCSIGRTVQISSKEDDNKKIFRHTSKNISKAIRDIPDAILLNTSLGFLDYETFVIIIRGTTMYTYKYNKRKPIELHRYLRKYSNDQKIRSLSKISDCLADRDCVIFD